MPQPWNVRTLTDVSPMCGPNTLATEGSLHLLLLIFVFLLYFQSIGQIDDNVPLTYITILSELV